MKEYVDIFLTKSNYFRRNKSSLIPLFKTVVRFLSGFNLSSFRFSSKSFRENGENGQKKITVLKASFRENQ